MNWGYSFNGFEFHEHSGVNPEINSKSFLENHPLVFETNDQLPLDLKSPLFKRACQQDLVNRFQHPRTQVTVDS